VTVLKRDYYEVLGLPKDADEEEIREAFHALAREWHPDVAGTPDAEDRFRELAEAYTVLSKRESRALYDRYGYRGRGSPVFDEELLGSARGEDVYDEIELRTFEAEEGARRLVTFHAAVRCATCMGRGSMALPDPECEYCEGTGRKRTVAHVDAPQILQMQPCPACITEPCLTCGGTGLVDRERRLRLRIPPGVEDEALLRVRGEGNDGPAGSAPGDLLVRVRVLPPPRDRRIVRYVALALLVVAVAMLALYLVR
jgi:molecular chaperone DnaJ